MSNATEFKKLDRLYARLPKLECKGLCQESCGPIEMSQLERLRLLPVTITNRHHAMAQFLRTGDFTCDALGEDGRCTVYSRRPLICRLWGSVEIMKCPHGCVPEGGFISSEEAGEMIRESLRIGGEP